MVAQNQRMSKTDMPGPLGDLGMNEDAANQKEADEGRLSSGLK